jgi:hypothetical protein
MGRSTLLNASIEPYSSLSFLFMLEFRVVYSQLLCIFASCDIEAPAVRLLLIDARRRCEGCKTSCYGGTLP